MRHQRVADRAAGTRNEVDDARREAGLVQQIDELSGDDRRIARRLEYDCIARDERRSRHAGHDREGKVPRRDHDADAERNVGEPILFARNRRQRRRVRVAQRFARVELQKVDRLSRVRIGFDPTLADFEDEQRVEVIAPLPNELGRFEEVLRPLFHGDALPRFEGAEGGTDRIVRLLERGRADASDHFTRLGRIVRFDTLRGLDAAAVDHKRVMPA